MYCNFLNPVNIPSRDRRELPYTGVLTPELPLELGAQTPPARAQYQYEQAEHYLETYPKQSAVPLVYAGEQQGPLLRLQQNHTKVGDLQCRFHRALQYTFPLSEIYFPPMASRSLSF